MNWMSFRLLTWQRTTVMKQRTLVHHVLRLVKFQQHAENASETDLIRRPKVLHAHYRRLVCGAKLEVCVLSCHCYPLPFIQFCSWIIHNKHVWHTKAWKWKYCTFVVRVWRFRSQIPWCVKIFRVLHLRLRPRSLKQHKSASRCAQQKLLFVLLLNRSVFILGGNVHHLFVSCHIAILSFPLPWECLTFCLWSTDKFRWRYFRSTCSEPNVAKEWVLTSSRAQSEHINN